MGVPVQTLPPSPGPQPMMPPGVQPPPPMPAPQDGGAAPGSPAPPGPSLPGAAGPGAAPPPPPADQGASPLPPGTGAPPDPQGPPGEVRPRLIPGTDAQQGNVPASPDEQNDLHQLMVKVGTMIHGRASRDQVLDSLHQPNLTVAQAVGHTAAGMLMAANEQKKAVTKQPIDNEVLNEAAKHVIPELLDLGISAGIFPIQPPGGENAQPGVGSDPYNKAMRMALLEATKVYGESLLRQPNAQQISSAAGDMWALGVRKEMADGTASPEYKTMVQQKGAGAPPAQLIPPAGGTPADPGGPDGQPV